MPYFSIIIPTFNSGSTIRGALNSLLEQTYSDFEVIIVDGLSLDDTVLVVKSYEESGLQCRWVSEKDEGIYDAMNKGIEKANGSWLYFLGSNDYLINNSVLEDLVKLVNFDDYDFIYGNIYSPEYGERYDGAFDWQKILNRNIGHQALFIRKELFHRLGKFKIKYRMLADYEFNLRAMFNRKVRKKFVDLTIAYYGPNGLSSTRTDDLFNRDKNYLVLKYGFTTFNWRQRFQLVGQILGQLFT